MAGLFHFVYDRATTTASGLFKRWNLSLVSNPVTSSKTARAWLLAAIDRWAADNGCESRSEAMRRLMERGLGRAGKPPNAPR